MDKLSTQTAADIAEIQSAFPGLEWRRDRYRSYERKGRGYAGNLGRRLFVKVYWWRGRWCFEWHTLRLAPRVFQEARDGHGLRGALTGFRRSLCSATADALIAVNVAIDTWPSSRTAGGQADTDTAGGETE